ncbi:MBL fold metallo-hydrolase, partial [Patescibacteria group bacterium]
REVSGSCTLLEYGGTRVLVDCGMIQGGNNSYQRNLEKFPFDPASLDVVLLTHAHIDHTGRIPKLIKEGFDGRVFATQPTRLLSLYMWRDAAHVMKDDARRHGRERLYTGQDVIKAYEHVHGVKYGTKVKISDGISVKFHDAGHIFGSSFIEMTVGKKQIIFSGDVGNDEVPILRPTENLSNPDIVVMESTYGDRMHEDSGTRYARLKKALLNTIEDKGVLLIPAFSLERTQEILYELNLMVEHKEVPSVPVFLDSPLAIKILPIYHQFTDYYDTDAKQLKASGDDFFKFPGLEITKKGAESEAIHDVPPPKVIIAGSGMMHGGRIMHHLVDYLNNPKTTVLVVGFQSAGTLGRAVVEGAQKVHIDGEEIAVRASVDVIRAYSAHADQEKLLRWLVSGKKLPKRVYLNHGESHSAEVLADRIDELFGIETVIPNFGETYEN